MESLEKCRKLQQRLNFHYKKNTIKEIEKNKSITLNLKLLANNWFDFFCPIFFKFIYLILNWNTISIIFKYICIYFKRCDLKNCDSFFFIFLLIKSFKRNCINDGQRCLNEYQCEKMLQVWHEIDFYELKSMITRFGKFRLPIRQPTKTFPVFLRLPVFQIFWIL